MQQLTALEHLLRLYRDIPQARSGLREAIVALIRERGHVSFREYVQARIILSLSDSDDCD